MKHIESLLSFVIAVVELVLPRKWRRVPPCCPCPYARPAVPDSILSEMTEDKR